MGQSKTTQLNRNTQTPRTPEPTVRHIVEQLATAREHWLESSSSREKHKRKRFRAHPVAVVVLVVAVDEDLLLPLLPAAAAAATCASLASLSLFAAPLPVGLSFSPLSRGRRALRLCTHAPRGNPRPSGSVPMLREGCVPSPATVARVPRLQREFC